MVKSMGVGDTIYFGPKPNSSCSTTCASRPIRTTPASSSNSSELPTNGDTDYEGGNLGHRIGTKKGYFPVPPQDSLQDMRGEMLGVDGQDGRQGREASPRSGVSPARTRPEIRADDLHGRPDCRSISTASIRSRTSTARPQPSCRSLIYRRQRLGHALPPVDLEGRQAGVRRQQVRRPVGNLPVLHRRRHQARQGGQRLHQPDDELLQASGARLRSAGVARLLGAQPFGFVPYSVHDQPEGQARRGALPRSARQSVSRLCGAADGAVSTASRTSSIPAKRWTRISTTCRRRN